MQENSAAGDRCANGMVSTLSPSVPLGSSPQIIAGSALCRACGTELERTVIDLGMAPLGGRYLRPEQLRQMEPFYPLHLQICDHCFLVQLSPFDDGALRSDEDPCFSSSSPSWLEHARRYSERAIEELRLTPAQLVVEVGSNDGYLLQYFAARGIPVLGIDAAAKVARAAIARDVPTRLARFDRGTATALREEGIQADLLIGNNVLDKVHEVNDFVAAMKRLLAPRGVITMEFPYLMRLIDGIQFDTIRHNRLSYLSLCAVTSLLGANGLTIYDVDELDTHGGSLRIFACHSEDPLRPITPRVDSLMARERAACINSPEYYTSFANVVRDAKGKLLEFLIGAKRDGKSIAGYGAPASSATLLNYCGIHTDFIDYTVDTDPAKHGHYLPGTHIPIHPPERLAETRPDYVMILSTCVKEEILPQLDYIKTWGGRCVSPIPQAQLL
ncbi:MAG TPA: class I SAM-dependent methyltransferase [Gemmatimonadales bacterium]|nr:class I SAM-dependent methyltransferase [Gemmatimonadales bacterium]